MIAGSTYDSRPKRRRRCPLGGFYACNFLAGNATRQKQSGDGEYEEFVFHEILRVRVTDLQTVVASEAHCKFTAGITHNHDDRCQAATRPGEVCQALSLTVPRPSRLPRRGSHDYMRLVLLLPPSEATSNRP